MSDEISRFDAEKLIRIKEISRDFELQDASLDWMIKADKYKYSYNFEWMGVPIIKYPNDMIVYQELIWDVKPELIIETGIAHGGSLLFSASILELIGNGEVVGVDNDIRDHNRDRIEKLPIAKRIKMLEGDSLADEIHRELGKMAAGRKTLVVLDSLHTHEHVLNELNLYSKYVSKDSYIVLPDTFIEFFPKNYYSNRSWDVGNNPMTAIREFLGTTNDFIIDQNYSNKALISETLQGYVKRIK